MMRNFKIVIIDYGMGNVQSIINAIEHVGEYDVVVTADKNKIISSDCIILPGVGAFPDAMKKLHHSGLIDTLNKVVKEDKKPTLGICLGMQLLFDVSEEVETCEGLGWIPGRVAYMNPGNNLRVPHVGWNSLLLQQDSCLFEYLNKDKDFYFVHSLHVVCEEQFVLAKFEYGDCMTAAVKNENVIGMQFHPEKSQKNGLSAIGSFLDWAKSYSSIGGLKDA